MSINEANLYDIKKNLSNNYRMSWDEILGSSESCVSLAVMTSMFDFPSQGDSLTFAQARIPNEISILSLK